MKDQVLKRAKEIAAKAKANTENGQSKSMEITLSSGNENSLKNVIKTQEQGKIFMAMLKNL